MGKSAPGTGINEVQQFLAFGKEKAAGTYETLNWIHSYIVSFKNLKLINRLWPETSVPKIENVVDFFLRRLTADGGNLMDLLSEPSTQANGWYKFRWKAYDAEKLPHLTTSEV